jgi:hypothetical protein
MRVQSDARFFQIVLLADILLAYMKREFSLHHGLHREINGKTTKLVLE